MVNGEPLTVSEEYFCTRQPLPNGVLDYFFNRLVVVVVVGELRSAHQTPPKCDAC